MPDSSRLKLHRVSDFLFVEGVGSTRCFHTWRILPRAMVEYYYEWEYDVQWLICYDGKWINKDRSLLSTHFPNYVGVETEQYESRLKQSIFNSLFSKQQVGFIMQQ